LNLLIFEYATAMGVKDPSITAEGQAMLQGLINDLGGLSASFLISIHADHMDGGNCSPVEIEVDLNEWIEENIHGFDFCLPLAPEEDFILYELTRLIEEKGVKIVGSSSDAVYTCSDKYLTYQILKNKVPVIPTDKILWKELERYFSNVLEGKKVVKPADGVSCSAVQVVDSIESFKDAAMKVKDVTNLPYFLLQDYVKGDNVSVSLLCDGKKAIPLSLNQQNVSQKNGTINYNGGIVPLNHPKENEAKKIAKLAVESIKGLQGYVGVDLILGDEVYVVEINSRLTTPYVALRNMLNFNLGEAIIDAVQGKLSEEMEVKLKGEVEFKKEVKNLQLEVIR
jgi:tyramine---L-glutamate ligase